MMSKSSHALFRMKQFHLDNARRQIQQLEAMISESEHMAQELDREIRVEENRVGINDPAHYAYPIYAKAAAQRRQNLNRSATNLRVQLGDAKTTFYAARDDFKKAALLAERAEYVEKIADDRQQTAHERQTACAATGDQAPLAGPIEAGVSPTLFASAIGPVKRCSKMAYRPIRSTL